MIVRPNLTQADRDRLDDHDVVHLDDGIGQPPHAQHDDEMVAS